MISIAETDPPVHGLSLGASLLRGAPRSYAILFFSANARLGWWLMAVSMFAPDYGISGLTGVLAAGALAWWLGYDRAQIRSGFLLFNPLLVCLTVAYLHRCYHFTPAHFLLLWAASVLGAFFVSAAMQQWARTLLGLSAHSLPAVAAAYVLYFLGFSLFGPPSLPDSSGAAWLELPGLPPFWQAMFQAFGAMLFQPHVIPGIMVFLGLALTSPLSTLVASLAFAVGAETMSELGFPLGPEGVTWCGFNFLLCGIALGSGYFITSAASLALAASGAFLCSLTSVALATALRYFNLPASALPYNLVVLALVTALRPRKSSGALLPSPSPGALPESAVQQVLIDAQRFPDLKTPALFPPVSVACTVTQGFDGTLTHRGDWRYALDFEVEKEGRKCRGDGASLGDFYTYGVPILAPCSGVIANIVNHIADNPPGGNNPDENWGNYIVIYSDAGYYVMLAHLQQHSATVFVGQRVARGFVLGACGNSGRSPFPHLHLQIQDTALAGSASRHFCLKHYLEPIRHGAESPAVTSYKAVYRTSGIPNAGFRVQPVTPNPAVSEILHGWLPGEYRYRISEEDGRVREETLLLDFDDLGRYRWRSRRTHARLIGFVSEGVFFTTEFQGDDRSLLAYFAAGLARMPAVLEPGVVWSDSVNAAPFFAGVERWLRALITPFIGLTMLGFKYQRLEEADTAFSIRATLEPGHECSHAPRSITCQLSGRRGVAHLEARLVNDQTLTAELVEHQPAGD
jgi:urea transporter